MVNWSQSSQALASLNHIFVKVVVTAILVHGSAEKFSAKLTSKNLFTTPIVRELLYHGMSIVLPRTSINILFFNSFVW